MKKMLVTLVSALLVGSGMAAEPIHAAGQKVKPYTLKTCPVSDEKLGGDMGDPYVFEHDSRQIKLCCKSCLKDFKKDPTKFLKKIEKAEKTEAKAK